MIVVVSGNGQTERNALLSLLGSLSTHHLPVLLVVRDEKDETYYRSLDPATKDMRVIGTISKYVTSQAGILNSLQNPPPIIKREFARVIDSAQLLENGGRVAKPSRPSLLAPFRRRRPRGGESRSPWFLDPNEGSQG